MHLRLILISTLAVSTLILLGQRSFAQTPAKTSGSLEATASGLKLWTLRLKPGQDLREELETFTKTHKIRAGFILTAVGSLQKAALRLADKTDSSQWENKFEIVSLVGTLSQDGPHLHLSISDGTGTTIGGHLVAGCKIYTTAEIVIGEAQGIIFTREKDAQTGYAELNFQAIGLQKNKSGTSRHTQKGK